MHLTVGVPVHITRDDRDAMKITEIVERARVLDAEKREDVARVQFAAETEEFESIYRSVLADVKRTDTIAVVTRCFVKHLDAHTIEEKLKARLASDGLPKPASIDVSNEDSGDECLCFWTSLFGCCLPLAYWAFYCVRKNYKGDAHTIRIQF